MSKQTPPTPAPVSPKNQKVQALQYLFDVARQAPVTAAIHDQCKAYATYLYEGIVQEPIAPAAPTTLAEAVAAVTGKPVAGPTTPAENAEIGSAAAPVASTEPFTDQGEAGPGV